MNARRIRRGLGVVAALVWLSAPAATSATTVVPVADPDLVRSADAIVIAWVDAMTSYRDADGGVHTLITLSVTEVLKGALTPGLLTIRQLGGWVGDTGAWIDGSPELLVGEKVLLFLDRHRDSALRIAHLFMGKFSVLAEDTTGEEYAYQEWDRHGVHVLGARGPAAPQPVVKVRSLDEVRQLVRAAAGSSGTPSLARAHAAATLPSGAVAESTKVFAPFTFLGSSPARWFEPDSGTAVSMKIDSRGHIPAPSGGGITEVRPGARGVDRGVEHELPLC